MEDRSRDLSLTLKAKVRTAELEYRRALEEYRRLTRISTATSDLNDPGFVDGNFAMRRAMQVHTCARRKYESALKEFTDFVLNGNRSGGSTHH